MGSALFFFSFSVRISLRKNPVLRDRLFTIVLAGAFVHGSYLVYPYSLISFCFNYYNLIVDSLLIFLVYSLIHSWLNYWIEIADSCSIFYDLNFICSTLTQYSILFWLLTNYWFKDSVYVIIGSIGNWYKSY